MLISIEVDTHVQVACLGIVPGHDRIKVLRLRGRGLVFEGHDLDPGLLQVVRDLIHNADGLLVFVEDIHSTVDLRAVSTGDCDLHRFTPRLRSVPGSGPLSHPRPRRSLSHGTTWYSGYP